MNVIKKILPVLSILLAIAVQIGLKNSNLHPQTKPYFTYVLLGILIIYSILFILTYFHKGLDEKISYKAYFIAGAVLFFNILTLVTAKLAILPVLYFPALDRVFGVMVEQREVLVKCVLYSTSLLGYGVLFGALVGIATGICIGFSKTFSYWVSPVIRVLGPIPSTAWIPLVLISFPTAVSASAFLIGLSVWFPTTIMTQKSCLESRTK